MALFTRIIGGVRALLRRRDLEGELDEELRAYLESAVEQKMSAGMSRDEATRAARVEIGSLEAVKDYTRDAGWESGLESVWQDLRYAVRSLRHARGFTAVAIGTLALGIGANTAIFSVINSLALKALPVAEPHRLVSLSSVNAISGGWTAGWDYAIWEQIRQRHAGLFDGALASSAFMQRFDVGQGGEMQLVDGLFASGEYFSTLGVPAILGRTFTAADDVPGGGRNGPTAVISFGFWQRHFGGAATVIGTRLIVEGIPFTVIGVTPPEFFGAQVGRAFDVAVPLETASLVLDIATVHTQHPALYLSVMLRLQPGQSIEAAATALRALQPQIVEAAENSGVPPEARTGGYRIDPFVPVAAKTGTSELRRQYERPLAILLAIVATVLLMACANLASLLSARDAARRHELTIRRALGAPRWRLVRHAMIESGVLAACGGICSLALAAWVSRLLVGQLSTPVDPVFLELGFDWRVLAFTTLVTAGTATVFGAMPAWRSARLSLPRHQHTRAPLVAQAALSLVLLIVAGLFVRSFAHLKSVPLGFDSDRVLIVEVNTARSGVDVAGRLRFYQDLVDAVSKVPGVAHAAASPTTPFHAGPIPVTPIVLPDTPGLQAPPPNLHIITPDWFASYGMAVHLGRNINAGDTRGAPAVAVVNDAFVRRFFPDGAAIGKAIRFETFSPQQADEERVIVGIVHNAVDFGPRGGAQPTIYSPLAQWPAHVPPPIEITLSVRPTAGPPARLMREIAAALTDVDRNLAFSADPLTERVDAHFAQDRLVATLATFFGALALLIAAIGLYGLTSYATSQRRTEIGLRLALGAGRGGVIRLVMYRTLAATAAGVGLGLALATLITRYIQGMLFGVSPLDPTTYGLVALLFGSIATLAALMPAWRAAHVDPMVALRYE